MSIDWWPMDRHQPGDGDLQFERQEEVDLVDEYLSPERHDPSMDLIDGRD